MENSLDLSLTGRRVNLLSEVPAFSDLPFSLLQQLEKNLQEEGFKEGTPVVSEGEKGDRLYLILEGRAEVSAKGPSGPVVLATLCEGEVFGEIALLTRSACRTATVTAITPLRTFFLEGGIFQSLLISYPEAKKVLTEAADRLVISNFIKLASPFSTMEPSRRRWLASRLTPLSVEMGETIIRQGEEGSTCFLVRAGQVEVVQEEAGSEKRLAVLGAGSLFGEAALLLDSVRNATVRALEPSDLIVLERSDLLLALSDREVGARLFDLLSLRDRPRRAEGVLSYQRTTGDGVPITILKDPRRGVYYNLSPAGCFLWQRLDGRHNLKDLTLEYFEAFQAFAPHAIAEVVAGLVAAGFVMSGTLQVRKVLLPSDRSRGWRDHLRHLLEWRVVLRGADPFLTRLYQGGFQWIFTWPAQVLIGSVTLMGFAVFPAKIGGVLFREGMLFGATAWIVLILLLFVNIVIHEAGHAFAVKAYGREVMSVGFGWNWLTPIFYVDTSDMWLAGRWPRVTVSLAGPYANLFLASGFVLVHHVIHDPAWSLITWEAALVSYVIGLVNLVPLMRLDGHDVLTELLRKSPPHPSRNSFN